MQHTIGVSGPARVRAEDAVRAIIAQRVRASSEKDDDSDITDHLGCGDLTALYRWRGHTFEAMVRGNPRTGNGAGELTWSSPRLLGPVRLYAQLFTGYGESMIDYNWNQTTIGAGIALNDLP